MSLVKKNHVIIPFILSETYYSIICFTRYNNFIIYIFKVYMILIYVDYDSTHKNFNITLYREAEEK